MRLVRLAQLEEQPGMWRALKKGDAPMRAAAR
jgi:hypothetical protein